MWFQAQLVCNVICELWKHAYACRIPPVLLQHTSLNTVHECLGFSWKPEESVTYLLCFKHHSDILSRCIFSYGDAVSFSFMGSKHCSSRQRTQCVLLKDTSAIHFQNNWGFEHLLGYLKNSWRSSRLWLKPLQSHKTSWCVDVAPVSKCTANTAFQILNNFRDVCIPWNMTERWFISESRHVVDVLIVSAF